MELSGRTAPREQAEPQPERELALVLLPALVLVLARLVVEAQMFELLIGQPQPSSVQPALREQAEKFPRAARR